MKYALDSFMAKEVDRYTMEETGLPGIVLMERAAIYIAEKTAQIAAIFNRSVKIAAVAGCGNNGGDAIAAARILTWQGMNVDVIIVGNTEHKTDLFKIQEDIALKSRLNFVNKTRIPEYDIIIDGIFGIGLKGEVNGIYAGIIDAINNSRSAVVSVDVPSGVDASTGRIHGRAVKAAATVTFGYNKTGMLMYPAKEYAGEITVADIGFNPDAIKKLNPPMYFTHEDLNRIPARIEDSNKGTYGRILIIAGSRDMSGAAYLSGLAAYKSGAGLVEILTHKDNTEILKNLLPEAIIRGYDDCDYGEKVAEALNKADVTVLGPGLSTDNTARGIVRLVASTINVPLIIDADALNIISEDISVLKNIGPTVIITPHIRELERLSGLDKEDITKDSISFARNFSSDNNVILVMKNAVTIVAEPSGDNRIYINTSGNGAMSKAGMGDVLTGIIAGMLSLKLKPFSAAAMGVYIHGTAGDIAADDYGAHSVTASEAAMNIGKIVNSKKRK